MSLSAPRPRRVLLTGAPESHRDGDIQSHLHGATLCMYWAFVLALSALGLVWIYHMVAPEKYWFLSDVQKSKLDIALLTATTTLFVAERSKRLFKH